MHGHRNIEVMGFNPITTLPQQRIQYYTQIYTQQLQYRSSLYFLDVVICVVVVHCSSAHPVRSGPIGPGPEVGGCPPLAQGIPSFSILDRPINFTEKLSCQFLGLIVMSH
jgi:hypothetical protein